MGAMKYCLNRHVRDSKKIQFYLYFFSVFYMFNDLDSFLSLLRLIYFVNFEQVELDSNTLSFS